MALGDFNYDPSDGWNNVDEFPDYPARDQVRPLLQKLFDQVKTWLNGTVKTFVNGIDTELTAHKAVTVADTDGVHGLKIGKGTFTPTLAGGTTAGNNTYSIQKGYYTLIDKRCFIDIYIKLSAKDAAMAGVININGLPFAAKGDTNRRCGFSIGFHDSIALPADKPFFSGNIIPGLSNISLTVSGASVVAASVTATMISNTSGFVLSGSYEIS